MNIELKERSREDLLDIISAKDMKIVMQNVEIERLNNIIDKAIEYIDWQRRNPQYDNVWRNAECEDLIEILRGEVKNE